MYTKGNYTHSYNNTKRIDITNKKIILKENTENQNIPYSKITQIQLKLFDFGGEVLLENTNIKFYTSMKALIILFDITNTNSFNNIKNTISICKNNYTKNKKEPTNIADIADNNIKQPECFNEIPILIVGNKSDLNIERSIQKNQIDDLILDLNKDNSYSFIKYYEISIKNNSGIDDIFNDIIFYYFKRKIDNDAISINNNNINDNQNKINENNKKIIKKPSLEKDMFFFHQILDKVKKEFIMDITSLKEENKKEIDKNKKMEEKLEFISNDFNNEKNILKEKLNIFENKTNELEQKLKLKDEEIYNLKQKINELLLLNKDINLKFKISNENIKDEIIINTKGEVKIYEVLSKLYELCPSISNMNIKGFCIEGKENEKIDEMKTVDENKLVNGSLIVLMV